MKVEVAVLGSPSLTSPSGLCGRKATIEEEDEYDRKTRICVKVEVDVPGLIVPNSPYGLSGHHFGEEEEYDTVGKRVRRGAVTHSPPECNVVQVGNYIVPVATACNWKGKVARSEMKVLKGEKKKKKKEREREKKR